MIARLKRFWCEITHGGGDILRDEQNRINWRCRKCGRWSDNPVEIEDEIRMTNEALARIKMEEEDIDYVDYDTEGNPTWIMKDGSLRSPPTGWQQEFVGFSATKISDDGKNLT